MLVIFFSQCINGVEQAQNGNERICWHKQPRQFIFQAKSVKWTGGMWEDGGKSAPAKCFLFLLFFPDWCVLLCVWVGECVWLCWFWHPQCQFDVSMRVVTSPPTELHPAHSVAIVHFICSWLGIAHDIHHTPRGGQNRTFTLENKKKRMGIWRNKS